MATTPATIAVAAAPVRLNGSGANFIANGINYNEHVLDVRLENEAADSKGVSLADALRGGGRKFFVRGSLFQATEVGSLWRYIYDNPNTKVDFYYAPHHNAVPTADQPWFAGQCNVGARLNIGGVASGDADGGDDYTVDYEFPVVGTPTLIQSNADLVAFQGGSSNSTGGSTGSGS